jgi:hypothetical protein
MEVAMNLIIDLNPIEEARISAAARQIGLAPADYVKKLVNEHMPSIVETKTENDPTLALFAQWDKEDAQMTSEEVEQENRTWEEFKTNINTERKRSGAREVF